jgi:hypothetical protein
MDYLNALGALKSEIQRADELQTPLELFMRDAGNMFTALMRDKIDEDGVNANFIMRQELINPIVSDPQGVTIDFQGVDYTQMRNDGVSGTETQRDTPFSFQTDRPSMKMVDDIREWIRAKGLLMNEWATAINVLRHGYEGAKFIERSFSDENLNSFENALLLLTEQYTTGQFERILPNLK